MSKLFILANDYKTIANFRMELLESLIAEKHEVYLSLPEDPRNAVYEEMGCEVVTAPVTRHGTNPLKELRLLRSYKKQMRKVQPDCVLTFTVKPNIYGSIAAASMKIPFINNVTGMGSVMQNESLMKKFMLRLQKFGFRKSSCVFFQNNGNLEYYRSRGIVGGQARLLPGSGVNLDLHSFSEYPSEEPWIDFITVSRLRQDKGFDELFSAMDSLLPLHNNIRFHIVGWIEEERYREILTRYEGDKRVIYHGEKKQSEVHEIIRQCHCLIHPSYHEGMANVLMEAAAAGRPALVSNIYGCREGIDEGISGYTFEVRNGQAIAAAVEKYLTGSQERHSAMGKAARAKMEREFDRQLVIEKYLEQIRSATARRKP